MSYISDTLKKVSSLFSSKGLDKKIHRRVAIVGLDAESCESLTLRLLEGSQESIAALQSDDPAVVAAQITGPVTHGQNRNGLPKQFSAVYVAQRRIAHLRRWFLYLVDQANNNEQSTVTEWKMVADTCLVCWPYRLFSENPNDLHDRLFPIIGAIGAAKAHGRMRRIAIVVTDVPPDEGCCHPSQLRLDLRGRRTAQEEINQLLSNSNSLPGHELADPRWRQFLTRVFSRNRAFVRSLETFSRTLGKPCPILFLPTNKGKDLDGTRILAWVDRSRERSKTGSKVWPRLVLAGSLGLLLLVTALCLSIPSRADDDAILAVSGGSSRASKELATRCRMYDKSVAIACFLYNQVDYRGEIASSLSLLKAAERALGLETLRRQCALDIGNVLHTGAHSSVVKQLDSLIAAETGLLNEARRHEPSTDVRSSLLDSWRFTIDRLSLLRDIGASLDTTKGQCFLASFSALRKYGYSGCADSLMQWAGALDRLASYDRGIRLDHDTVLLRWLQPTRLSTLITPPSLQALIDGILHMPLYKAVAMDTRTRLRNSLNNSQRLSRQTNTVGNGSVQRADAMLSLLDSIARPQEMVLSFTRFGETSWHIDVCESPGSGYVPCQWIGESCFVRLSSVAVGDVLYLIFNPRSQHHMLTTNASEACAPGPATVMTLTLQSGSITCSDTDFRVDFKIVQGWPNWPPEMANIQGAV